VNERPATLEGGGPFLSDNPELLHELLVAVDDTVTTPNA
jgi:hypothetical protein